jgi:hypothetical protein
VGTDQLAYLNTFAGSHRADKSKHYKSCRRESALTSPSLRAHHETGVIKEGESLMFLAQTMAEYGILTSLIAALNAARYRLETYIGTGNSKYLFIGLGAIVFLLLVRRRRSTRWQ